MKRIIALILCAAAIVCVLSSCSEKEEMQHPEGVELVKDQSTLVDVERVGNNAVIYCTVAIRNSTDKTSAVKLYANFPDEYKNGMYAIDFAVGKVDGSEMVAVPANDTLTVDAVFEVAFASG